MSNQQLRRRGVAIVVRHGHVLLVRDKGKKRYSLPGGGVHYGERSHQAAARELYEETGLKATKTSYIGSFHGSVSYHKAFLVEATGHIQLNRHELDDYQWWDMKSYVPVFQHVKSILAMLH